MPQTEMTKSLVAALHNEQVDILGHPTGHIIQKREPVPGQTCRLIFDAAAGQGISLEINALLFDLTSPTPIAGWHANMGHGSRLELTQK